MEYTGHGKGIKLCKRCGRRLRSIESRERGYGKSCWEKSQKEAKPLFQIGIDKSSSL